MEKERDDLDELIMNSVKDIKASSNYTKEIIKKINYNNEVMINPNKKLIDFSFRRKISISFILTGLFFFMMSSNSIDSAVNVFQVKVKEIHEKSTIKFQSLDKYFKIN